jgi:hypothetical protein
MRQASHTFLPHLCLTGHIFMCLKSTGLRSQSSAHQYNALMGAVLWPTSEWDRPLPGKDYNRRLLRSAGGASAYTGATSPRTGAGKQGDGSASNRLHRRSPTRASPQATASELPIYEEASLPVLAQDNMQPSLSSNPATPKKLSVMYVGMARGELGILTKRLVGGLLNIESLHLLQACHGNPCHVARAGRSSWQRGRQQHLLPSGDRSQSGSLHTPWRLCQYLHQAWPHPCKALSMMPLEGLEHRTAHSPAMACTPHHHPNLAHALAGESLSGLCPCYTYTDRTACLLHFAAFL